MLLKAIGKASYIQQYIWLFLLVGVLSLPAIYGLQAGKLSAILPLPTLWSSFIQLSPVVVLCMQLAALIGLPILALLFRYQLENSQLSRIYNLFPAILFVVVFGFWDRGLFLFWHLIYLSLILFSAFYLFNSIDSPKAKQHILSASVLLSLSSFLSYSSLLLMPIVWISFVVFQQYSWRYFFVSIIGFVLPYWFVLSYFYLSGSWEWLMRAWVNSSCAVFVLPTEYSLFQIMATFLLFISGSIALRYVLATLPKRLILLRRKTNLSLVLFLLSLYPFFFLQDGIGKSVTPIMLLAFISYYVQENKKYQAVDMLMSLFLLLVLIFRYSYFYA